MKRHSLFVLLVYSILPLAAATESMKRDFEADAVGQPPAGFEFARTGGGAEGKWVVRTEKGADKNHVLVQESADRTDYRFPVAVLKEGVYTDLEANYTGNGTMGAYFLTNWEPFAYYIFRHHVKAPFLKKRVRQIFFNGEGKIIPAVS